MSALSLAEILSFGFRSAWQKQFTLAVLGSLFSSASLQMGVCSAGMKGMVAPGAIGVGTDPGAPNVVLVSVSTHACKGASPALRTWYRTRMGVPSVVVQPCVPPSLAKTRP